MSVLIEILLKLLPVILQLLGLGAGYFSLQSYNQLSATGQFASAGDAIQNWYVGGQGALAATLFSGSYLQSWYNRRRAMRKIDWHSAVGSLGGFNVVSLFKFGVRVIQLVKADPEASRLFTEIFATNTTALPTDSNDLMQLALRHVSK